jgi:hypothetical protein
MMINLDEIEARWPEGRLANSDARADVVALVARVRELEVESRRFRDWYRNAFGGPNKRETPWDPCACEECESLRRLKEAKP